MKLTNILREIGAINPMARSSAIQTMQQSTGEADEIKQQLIMAVTKADLKNHQQVQQLVEFLEGSIEKLKQMG